MYCLKDDLFPQDRVKSLYCLKFMIGCLIRLIHLIILVLFGIRIGRLNGKRQSIHCIVKMTVFFLPRLFENNLFVICHSTYQVFYLVVFKYRHSYVMFVFNPPLLISNKDKKKFLRYGKTFLLYNLKDESIIITEQTMIGFDLVCVESIISRALFF